MYNPAFTNMSDNQLIAHIAELKANCMDTSAADDELYYRLNCT